MSRQPQELLRKEAVERAYNTPMNWILSQLLFIGQQYPHFCCPSVGTNKARKDRTQVACGSARKAAAHRLRSGALFTGAASSQCGTDLPGRRSLGFGREKQSAAVKQLSRRHRKQMRKPFWPKPMPGSQHVPTGGGIQQPHVACLPN